MVTGDSRNDAEKLGMDRRHFVIDGNQQAYTQTGLRWSCADVAGVNNKDHDDRGQERVEDRQSADGKGDQVDGLQH